MKKIILIVGFVLVVGFILVGIAAYLDHRKTTPLASAPAHGTSFTIEADLSKTHGDPMVMVNLETVLRNRFAKLGFRVFVESISDSKIRIIAPFTELKEVETVGHSIFQGGYFEIRLVHDNSEQLIENGAVPADFEVLSLDVKQRNGGLLTEKLVVKKEPERGLAGDIIKSVFAFAGDQGDWKILINFNPESAAALAKVTRDNLNRQLAFVVNGKVYSAPIILGSMDSGNCEISGHFTQSEATALVDLLNNPCPIPFKVLETKTF